MKIFIYCAFLYYKMRRKAQLWKNKINVKQPLKLQLEFKERYSDRALIYEDVDKFINRKGTNSENIELLQEKFDTIFKDLLQLEQKFDGKYFQCGGLDVEAEVLFALLNCYDRASIAEIGVANGFSSRFVFDVAHTRNHEIVSIDLPRFSTSELTLRQKTIAIANANGWLKDTGTIQDLREGGVIPQEAFASWMVPITLKERVVNTAFYGNVFSILPGISLQFDIIIIDAMKEYSLRKSVLKMAFEKLNPGGAILFDGYWVNSAFEDFCHENGISFSSFGKIGILRQDG
jgi:hypothetical protein